MSDKLILKEVPEEKLDILSRTLQFYEAMKVETYDDNVLAADVRTAIKNRTKELEKARLTLVKPIKDHAKMIDNRYKEYTSRLNATDEILEDKIKVYQDKIEVERKAEEGKLNKESQAKYLEEVKESEGEGKTPPPPPAPIQVKKQEVEGQQVRKPWTFEVLDSIKIPRKYLILKESLVREAIQDGVREISGLRIYQDTKIARG